MKKILGELPVIKYFGPPWRWRKFSILNHLQILKVFVGSQFRFEVLNVVNYKS